MDRTSPEIPYTVEADPYTTPEKAAAARPGEGGPVSTGVSAVGTPGRGAHGTREILPPAGGRAWRGVAPAAGGLGSR